MVSVIQLTLCVHVEQKAKQQDISSCTVIFTVLKDYNFQFIIENLKRVDSNLFNLNEKDQVNTLLYGSQTNDSKY